MFKSNVEVSNYLTLLDWVVFFFIFLITILAVWYGWHSKNREKNSSEKTNFLDLLLMGRRLTLPLFIATLVATWYGGIFGVTKIAFESGLFNFLISGIFWYVSYIIFAFFLVHRIRKYNALTLPELVEKLFGPKSAKLAAIFNFLNVLPIVYLISLGLFIKILFGISLWVAMLLGLIAVVGYSLTGGFRAVVFSDVVQFGVMCLSVFLILLFSYLQFGGIDYLRANLPVTHFSLKGDRSWLVIFVWGFIALSTLVDPNFYQRCFAAASDKVAKRGILISTLIWICFDLCTTLGAMYARAAIPEADSKSAYLIYAIQILPDGVKGFILAGILATILSTIDSYLFVAGTTITYDLAPKKMKESVLLNHIGVLSAASLALLLAIFFEGDIRAVWKTLGSYSAACMLFPVMCGYLFPKKISDYQFVISSLMGVVATTYWRHATHSGFWQNVDELYIGIAVTALGLFLSSLNLKYKN